ncbi:MAG: hypothetical protein ACJAS1_005005, partial [Oleiphilaceae bacterium]
SMGARTSIIGVSDKNSCLKSVIGCNMRTQMV